MLQADEIIQQKEWQQLNAAEKAIVAELAGNEAEFNLLKKMLMVSAEEVSEIPPVSPSVQQKIKATLPVVKTSSSHKTWYAAAAAVLVITIAAFFILKKENKPDVTGIPIVKENVKTPVIDSIPSVKDVPVLVKDEKSMDQPKRSTPASKPVFHSLKDTAQHNYLVMDVSVSSDPSLLELVGEVE